MPVGLHIFAFYYTVKKIKRLCFNLDGSRCFELLHPCFNQPVCDILIMSYLLQELVVRLSQNFEICFSVDEPLED